jgi:hypothetical protein
MGLKRRGSSCIFAALMLRTMGLIPVTLVVTWLCDSQKRSVIAVVKTETGGGSLRSGGTAGSKGSTGIVDAVCGSVVDSSAEGSARAANDSVAGGADE